MDGLKFETYEIYNAAKPLILKKRNPVIGLI